jgi:MarR family transcriptional regulator, transcriptional regulator for hemolysin
MFGEQVGALRRTMHRVLARRIAPFSPRPFQQLLALRVIAQRDARTQTELAERLLIDAPAASRLVALLVQDGLLRCSRGADRRCVEMEITRAAEPIVAAFRESIAGMSRDAQRHLGKSEFDTLMRLMRKTEELFAEEGAPCVAPCREVAARGTRPRKSGGSPRRRRSRDT